MEMERLDRILAAAPRGAGALIRILTEIQREARHLAEEDLDRVARRLGVSLSHVYGVASFYNAFSFEPRGRRHVCVCQGTACHVRGAGAVAAEAERVLGVPAGRTTPDGEFTLERVNCVGACAMGPVVIVDGKYHAQVKPQGVEALLRRAPAGADAEGGGILGEPPGDPRPTGPRLDSAAALETLRARLVAATPAGRREVLVCGGTGCRAYDSLDLSRALRRAVEAAGLAGEVEVTTTGCPGFCEQGPLVLVRPSDVLYCRVAAGDAEEIVRETLAGGRAVERLLFLDSVAAARMTRESDVPFYAAQTRALLGLAGRIDPRSIDDYVRRGGYRSLARALGATPEAVIAEIRAAGLRGRGGAGFPTATKWEICRRAAGTPKYLVCNGDEGDPGSFQDRALLESDPHGVLEGMIIGAHAIGAARGFAYVRAEYPLAIRHLQRAIEDARALGLLGERILGSDLSFDVEVVQGAGAFVCGEETALLASVEGARGNPRPRPPYPAESGLWGRPTNINNVKTWRAVPLILEGEDSAFLRAGSAGNRGTMVFSLVGNVRNTGLVEVPMGIRIADLVEKVGGGVPKGRQLKAVQVGGPSGGCVPAALAETPIDYESMARVGAIVGSGGVIVMDDASCMVDVARYFIRFTRSESCGHCVPCRMGTREVEAILDRIAGGAGRVEDLDRLEALGGVMKRASLCGLGRTAPNPVLTTLRHFRAEYEAHIRDRSCAALVCRGLLAYEIDAGACIGCTLCAKACPAEAIDGRPKGAHRIDQGRCTACGACFSVCPEKVAAVVRRTGAERLALVEGTPRA